MTGDPRLNEAQVGAISRGELSDPFAWLGPHAVPGGCVVRAFSPHAERLGACFADGERLPLEPRGGGVFEGIASGRKPGPYHLEASNAGGSWTLEDPYRFAPVLGALDDHLLLEGRHLRLHHRLGAHPCIHEGVPGVSFAVWAPNALRVALVGDFNDWDARRHPMRKRVDSGVWELFIPQLGPGCAYKYQIVSRSGDTQPLKADPFGFASELRPSTASVVTDLSVIHFSDEAYMAARRSRRPRQEPMSIYEVHLGSWRRAPSGGFLDYDAIAERLIPYVAGLGFTHLELLPVSEHPLDDSWGYQPLGLFCPTRRFGTPEGLARLVDAAHQAGLGVILDWVPAHFPTDAHGLRMFDGEPLYEHADPRRGYQPQWSTATFDYGRREVANYLIANALYWFEVFHIDGLRVDAVSSMLYLDYGRAAGEWSPNAAGGRENREAEAFIQHLNGVVHEAYPDVLMIAEESTDWPGVTRAPQAGGLGFDFKWNMGWMNDTLDYVSRDPVHRRHHHDEITFGLMYAFNEAFVLPLSHDEVVHGKGTILSRIPGDDASRFATLRAYYGFMWGHPGKKLLFMGQEFGQRREWDFRSEVEWGLLDHAPHQGLLRLVEDLNRLHAFLPALHCADADPRGFRWSVVEDKLRSVAAFLRFAPDNAEAEAVAIVCNFTPIARSGYRIGLPWSGPWREALNTDADCYGGSGQGNLGLVQASDTILDGFPASAELHLPALSALYLVASQPKPPQRRAAERRGRKP